MATVRIGEDAIWVKHIERDEHLRDKIVRLRGATSWPLKSMVSLESGNE